MAVTKNNITRLKDEADIAAVISFLQLEVKRKGNAYFILCPNPEHNDTHPTNCYYKDGWNHVYCCVCGTTINAVDLIMKINHATYGEACDLLWEISGRPDWYKDGWNHVYCCVCGTTINAVDLIMKINHATYGEACDLLWEISGRPDWYYEKKQKGQKKRFILSREDAELIGLRNPSKIKMPIAISDYKQELGVSEEYQADEINYYLKLSVKRVDYLDFLSEEEYLTLISEKTKEKAYGLQKKIKFLQSMKQALLKQGIRDPLTESMLHFLCEQRRNCFALAKRVDKFVKAA